MLLTLNPEDASIPVPISIIADNRLEGNEVFQASLSIPNNPPSGLGPSMVSTASITIIDDVCTLVKCSDAYTHRLYSYACMYANAHMHTCTYTHTI